MNNENTYRNLSFNNKERLNAIQINFLYFNSFVIIKSYGA